MIEHIGATFFKALCYIFVTFTRVSYSTPFFLVATTLTSCADEHFFPKMHPLFPGLDEAHVTAHSRQALAQAKVDFVRVRHGQAPQYAHFVGQDSKGKRYEGNGYQLTSVRNDVVVYSDVSPDIVIASSITGTRPFHYSEIERLQD